MTTATLWGPLIAVLATAAGPQAGSAPSGSSTDKPAAPQSGTPTANNGGSDQPATGGAQAPKGSSAEGPPPPTTSAADSESSEVTRYKFTGLDIDGELRTPALLQFLARIGGEFETIGIPHRSFMPELKMTAAHDAL